MLERVVLSYPASRVSEELQNILHVQRLGFTGAVPHPGGRGYRLLSGRSPPRCHAEVTHCGEGAYLPWVTRGCPPGSSRAQWLQRGSSAFLLGHQVGLGDLSDACEGP